MSHSSHHLLRSREQERASVSYSELLFDLIYVFAVTQLSHYLLHHLDWQGYVQEIILWFAVWLAWQHTTWVTNWFDPETRSIRILLFILMLVGLIMASAIPEAYTSRGLIFAACYVAIQLGRTIVIVFLLDKKHHLSPNFKRILGWFCLSAVFWITGAFSEGDTRILLWLVAVLCDYTSPMFGFYLPGLGRSISSKEWTIEGQHLAERSQLFVIIAFGETIMMTGASLSDFEIWDSTIIYAAIISFTNSLAMWWIYFDVSSEAGSRKIKKISNPGLLGLKYHSIHVVLVGALIICAVGDELVVNHPLGEMTTGGIFAMVGGPIIYLMSNAIYKWITCQLIAWSHVIAILTLALIIPFARFFNPLQLNGLTALIFIAVVIYETVRQAGRYFPAKS